MSDGTAEPGAEPEPDTGSDGTRADDIAGNETRCGFIAVIGAPNAGKSTLVNTLVGAKVAIVSRKVQTTRTTLRGIATQGQSQLVFIDTPGIFAPRRRLDRAMVDAAWGGAGDADLVLLVVDAARGIDEDVERILARLEGRKPLPLLALNKVDRVRKERLLELAAQLNARVPFAATFMISALDGDGVADLKAHLARSVPVGPWHYPPDEVTDAPLRVLAAEITREKIYDRLHDELPYQIAVETTAWREQGKALRIEQTILVERDSQKSIVLGKGGSMIKQLSTDARKEIADILGRPVHLFLFVKVREGWGDDPARYRDLGLTFPKE
jgi:GTP-binding protein Era